MASNSSDQPAASRAPHRRRIVLAFVFLALLGVGVVSRYALISALLDGVAALVVVLPAALAGVWLVPFLRLGPLPRRWHLLLGAALGIGLVSLLVLLLGLAGLTQRSVWVVIVFVVSAFGLEGLRRQVICRDDHRALPKTAVADLGRTRYLWLLAAPFFSLALLAASNAPGFIWQEEGYGYDVLEYHLQLPKEYRQAGGIPYVPHNVYANFPANVEMLYLLGMILQDGDVDTGGSANMIHLILAVLTVYAAWVAGCEWSPRAGIIAGVVTASTGWLAYLSGLAYVENGMLFFGMAATAALFRISDCGLRIGGRGVRQSPIPNPQSPITGRWIAAAGLITGFACGCKYTAVPMIALPLGTIVLLLPGRQLRRRLADGAVFAAGVLVTFSPWLVKNLVMTGNPVFPLANDVFQASPPGWGEKESERWDRGHSASPQSPIRNPQSPIESLRGLKPAVLALWRHVPGDRFQRFGPMILGLAILGLLGRRRDRTDLMLVVILLVQLAVWLFATHLYARFAVVLLIPLVLLAGRAVYMVKGGTRFRVIIALIVAGGVWNFAYAATLHRAESPAGAPASLIYNGKLSGYEYFKVVNLELPRDAKILLIGDAKAFYFRRQVDYGVVFNRNPFVEALRSSQSDGKIVDWLRDRGYTHVLVNWSEVRRLAGTYGFAAEINPALFQRLAAHGLSPIREFSHPQTHDRYVTLYSTTAETSTP